MSICFSVSYFKVTLKFGFPVELCRVDVELWPWGMDRGQACKRLEISTSSDVRSLSSHGQIHQQEQRKEQMKDQNMRNKQHQAVSSRPQQSNGHQWSIQAQHWEEGAQDGLQQTDFRSQSNSESSSSESEFKLVARCELREETQVSFSHPSFCHRAPFLSPPPPPTTSSRQEKLWSRGLPSLGAVTRLRVAVPFGGAASSLGLKALAVWGQPARCCPTEEVERIKKIHEANERRMERSVVFAPPVRQTTQTLQDRLR